MDGKSKNSEFINSAEDAVMKAVESYPKARRFVGNLPPEWIDIIPNEKRRETVRQIQYLFSSFAEKLYTPKSWWYPKDGVFADDFLKNLKQILGLDTSIEFIKSGEIGKAFKLEVGEKQYVFKTFHSDMHSDYKGYHGKILEPSRAPYAKKKGCKTFTDYYFGKIGTDESKDAFMVTKFEPFGQKFTPTEEIKRLLRMLKSPVFTSEITIINKLGSFDCSNLIGLKIIDFGHLDILPIKLNKELKKVAKSIEKYYFNTKKSWNKEEAVINEINNADCIFKKFVIDFCVADNLRTILRELAYKITD